MRTPGELEGHVYFYAEKAIDFDDAQFNEYKVGLERWLKKNDPTTLDIYWPYISVIQCVDQGVFSTWKGDDVHVSLHAAMDYLKFNALKPTLIT